MTLPGVTLLDGATGTELSRRGCNTRLPLWSARALDEHPDVLEEVHLDWLRAGARVLTTCTFRTHERSLARGGWLGRSEELNELAVQVARAAILRETGGGSLQAGDVLIAGSLSPLEDCFRPDLVPDEATLAREHRQQAESLASAGVDLLLVETMNCGREALASVRAAVATGRPAWCALTTRDRGRLLSGERIGEVAPALEDAGAAALLVNCVPARQAPWEVEALARATALPVGCYPNVGHADDVDGWRVDLSLTPEEFSAELHRCQSAGAVLLGGCCGTEPRHYAAL